jgi:EAL domain-containing protein (putative c-di-GMP-specific phosphodiesterase class I)
VIAEGIETEEMLDLVDDDGPANLGWHVQGVQGYLSGRPSPTLVGAPSHILLPRTRGTRAAGMHR